MRLVTIIATRPADEYGPFQTDNGFIADAVTRLASVPTHRAASIVDVDVTRVLKATCSEDDEMLSVQLVGHGSSGQLRLGACFMQDEAKARRWPYFVLDTTPSPLGFLAKFASRIGELTLVGCNVGAEQSDWPVNGRALLYCLSELLQCTTRGATAITSPEWFDQSGRYTGPSSTWQWSSAGPPTFRTQR
jgi:hypothetical protein